MTDVEVADPQDHKSRRVSLLLEFDGTAFSGWQRQANGERTVQGVLEAAMARLPGVHGSVLGAGRTDAGVHALAMVAHLDTTAPLRDEKLRLAINAHLPRDVSVLEVKTRAPDFQSQFDCLYRRYLYRMRVAQGDPRGLAVNRDRVLPISRTVDVAGMRRACEALVGRHDFGAFATQETRAPVREVYLCELRSERGELRLHIAADGFLRNMVRAIVGTLVWVGTGRLSAEDVPGIIGSRDRSRAGHNVAPHGLYFVEAGYRPWDMAVSEERVADLVI